MSKLSEQQEKFCRNIIEGMPQYEAYIAAGYADTASAHANASRMISADKIQNRIAEMRAEATQGSQITLQWLMLKAEEVLYAAMEDRSHAASMAAIKELGVLSGERIEKSERTNRNIQDVEDLDRSELLAIASRARAAAQDGRGDGPDSVH
jgi:phage terminase small subunit